MTPPKDSYPLCWPDRWPRTDRYRITSSAFGSMILRTATLEEMDTLVDVLQKLTGKYVYLVGPKKTINNEIVLEVELEDDDVPF